MDIAIQKAKEAGIGWVACKGEMHISFYWNHLTSVRVEGVGWRGGCAEPVL